MEGVGGLAPRDRTEVAALAFCDLGILWYPNNGESNGKEHGKMEAVVL